MQVALQREESLKWKPEVGWGWGEPVLSALGP